MRLPAVGWCRTRCVLEVSLESGKWALGMLEEVSVGCPEKAVQWTAGVWPNLRAQMKREMWCSTCMV